MHLILIYFAISFYAFDFIFAIFALECVWYVSTICIVFVVFVSRFDKSGAYQPRKKGCR